MAEIIPSRKILKNKEEIKVFMGGISDYMFHQYRKLEINGKKCGMPTNKVAGQWISFTDHIERWWGVISNFDTSKISDDEESAPASGQQSCQRTLKNGEKKGGGITP